MKVAELRQKGIRVSISHLRRFDNVEGDQEYYHRLDIPDKQPLPRGGKTVVTITIPSTDSLPEESFHAEAKCSDEDNYSKKTGVKIALGRAWYISQKPKEENLISEVYNLFDKEIPKVKIQDLSFLDEDLAGGFLETSKKEKSKNPTYWEIFKAKFYNIFK